MFQQILTYWLVAQAFGLVGLPLAQRLLYALPDRGYAFAKPLGLLLTGYLAWLLAMLGLAQFSLGLIIIAAVGIAGGGVFLARRASPEAGDLGLWLRQRWQMVLGYEVVFALALVFVAVLRSYHPDPHGTERPMDFAFFNAIQRSPSFPPHDPWMSGYSINYYYFGYLLMSVAALVGGQEPAVSFNLSLALTYALTALGIAGIVYNLIGLTRAERAASSLVPEPVVEQPDEPEPTPNMPDGEPWANTAPLASGITEAQTDILLPGTLAAVEEAPEPALAVAEVEQDDGVMPEPVAETARTMPGSTRFRQLTTVLAVVLALVFVLLAGNQGGALQVISGTHMILALNGEDMGRALLNGLGPREPLTLDPPWRGWDFDGTTTITPIDTVQDFNWWNPSRALWDEVSDWNETEQRSVGVRRYAITEFPFFSFWLGDMHPHVMALPFGLLALALALHTQARPELPAFGKRIHGWLELLLSGVILGSLYVINSWDFPTYLLMFLGSLLLLYTRHSRTEQPAQRTWLLSWQQWRAWAIQGGAVIVASLALFLPFYLTFRSLVGARDTPITIPILSTISRTIGIVTWSRTPWFTFVIIFGLFFVPLVAYVIAQYLPSRTAQADQETTPPHQSNQSHFLLWFTLVIAAIGLVTGFPLAALLPLALYAGQCALTRLERPAATFTLSAFALGCLILVGTEIVYIRDVFESRMNTIFKFYYQVWLIWGVLASYALWWLLARRIEDRAPQVPQHQAGNRLGLLGSIAVVLLVVPLLAGALVYPWLTAGKMFSRETPVGLNGKNPRQYTAEGEAAIAWLRANAPAGAVILEAVDGSYDTSSIGYGGVSSTTGLPAVLGWPGHEDQWRGGDPVAHAQIEPRKQDVTRIYTTTDTAEARALLDKYLVMYVFVGDAERITYPPEGFAKFPELGQAVFEQGSVIIYKVR